MRWLVLPLVLLAVGTVTLLATNGSDDAPDAGVTVEPYISPRAQIRQAAQKWAELFARGADSEDCRLTTQPLCERFACLGVGSRPIEKCTPPSAEFRKSFAHVRVEDVANTGGDHAGARLSNAEAVELIQVVEPEGSVWWVNGLGPRVRRKYFDER